MMNLKKDIEAIKESKDSIYIYMEQVYTDVIFIIC